MTAEMTAEVAAAVIPDATTVYAGALRRAGAMIIDTIITGILCMVLVKGFGLTGRVYNAVAQIAILAYFTGFEGSAWQATPGKRLLGIYLGDREGKRISPLRSLARYFVLYAATLPAVFLMFSDKFKAFDDSMRQVQQLSPDQRHAAIATIFHDNMGLLGELAIMGIGFLIISIVLYWLPIIFTKQKTGLHDILTNVRVLRKAKK